WWRHRDIPRIVRGQPWEFAPSRGQLSRSGRDQRRCHRCERGFACHPELLLRDCLRFQRRLRYLLRRSRPGSDKRTTPYARVRTPPDTARQENEVLERSPQNRNARGRRLQGSWPQLDCPPTLSRQGRFGGERLILIRACLSARETRRTDREVVFLRTSAG